MKYTKEMLFYSNLSSTPNIFSKPFEMVPWPITIIAVTSHNCCIILFAHNPALGNKNFPYSSHQFTFTKILYDFKNFVIEFLQISIANSNFALVEHLPPEADGGMTTANHVTQIVSPTSNFCKIEEEIVSFSVVINYVTN